MSWTKIGWYMLNNSAFSSEDIWHLFIQGCNADISYVGLFSGSYLTTSLTQTLEWTMAVEY